MRDARDVHPSDEEIVQWLAWMTRDSLRTRTSATDCAAALQAVWARLDAYELLGPIRPGWVPEIRRLIRESLQ